MRTKIIVVLLGVLAVVSCKNDETNSNKNPFSVGEGMEIYNVSGYHYNGSIVSYLNIDFDSIELDPEPILLYHDILNYDTLNHILNLTLSHDSLHFEGAGVLGGMFVVTLDKTPLYCGFKWRVMSSIPCQWVYIMEPYFELDGLAENQMQISFYLENEIDPRRNVTLFNRLKADGKLNN